MDKSDFLPISVPLWGRSQGVDGMSSGWDGKLPSVLLDFDHPSEWRDDGLHTQMYSMTSLATHTRKKPLLPLWLRF